MNIPRFGGNKEDHFHIENTFSERRKIYRIIQKSLLAVLFLCLLLSLETTWFSRLSIPLLGKVGQGAPALGLLFFMAVAYKFGERDGCVAGCITGFMYECLGGGGYLFLPLYFAIVGYAVGVVAKKFLAQNAPSFVIYAVMGGFLDGLRVYVTTCFEIGGLAPYQFVLYALLPRFLWTVLFSLLVYAPVQAMQKVLDK